MQRLNVNSSSRIIGAFAGVLLVSAAGAAPAASAPTAPRASAARPVKHSAHQPTAAAHADAHRLSPYARAATAHQKDRPTPTTGRAPTTLQASARHHGKTPGASR
jgi:hypothetical protein